MVFSDTTNKNGLIQDCEVLLNFPDAGISGDSTALKQFTNLINQGYLKVASYALTVSSGWQWDDSNYTDYPRGTSTLVNNQRDYTLPVASTGANASTCWKVKEVSILDTAGYELKLMPSARTEAQLRRLYTSAGTPREYLLVGNAIKLFPTPTSSYVTLTNGLIVYFARSPDLFSSSDTTQQPGLPEPFHRMISFEACIDYAGSRGLQSVQYFQAKLAELKGQLDDVMANRNDDNRARMMPRVEQYQ